jgi:hypothetical protein
MAYGPLKFDPRIPLKRVEQDNQNNPVPIAAEFRLEAGLRR